MQAGSCGGKGGGSSHRSPVRSLFVRQLRPGWVHQLAFPRNRALVLRWRARQRVSVGGTQLVRGVDGRGGVGGEESRGRARAWRCERAACGPRIPYLCLPAGSVLSRSTTIDPAPASDSAKGGSAHGVSLGGCSRAGAWGIRTCGIEGLSQCARATEKVRRTFVGLSGLSPPPSPGVRLEGG